MKKIIILLMAVSIMLTSCGKLTGLLNSNKKADIKSPTTIKKENPEQVLNKKPSAAGTSEKNLLQNSRGQILHMIT